MDAALASECSSGCESGWTVYLQEHSFLNQNAAASHRHHEFVGEDDDRKAKSVEASGEEEEDLSMVSDASSGPPHFQEEDSYFNAAGQGCFYSASSKAAKLSHGSKKRQRVKENKHQQHLQQDQHLPSFLDDTASSPLFDFSMNNVTVTNQQTSTESMLDYSQGFSATYFEGRSSLQDNFGFLHPSLSDNGVHSNKWY